MYSDLVFEGDNPQNFASKLFDTPPESEAVPFLALSSDWILQNLNAPFLPETRPFALELHSQNMGCTCNVPYEITLFLYDREYCAALTTRMGGRDVGWSAL